MGEKSDKTLFGLPAIGYGIASLVAACLAWGSVTLIVGVASGGAIFVVALLLFALIGVVSGLLGVGAGMYHKDLLAIMTAVLGLFLVGFLVLWQISNLKNF